jgi:hypothetical protein
MLKTMTDSERNLWGLKHKLMLRDEAHREAYLNEQAEAALIRQREENTRAGKPIDYPVRQHFNPVTKRVEMQTESDFAIEFRARKMAEPLASDAPYCDWIHHDAGVHWDHHVFVSEPHAGCGGEKKEFGDCQVRCTKCGMTIIGWEYLDTYCPEID